MASRAMRRGAITFSRVGVPVSMYAASRPGRIDLDLLTPRRRPAARRYQG
jgi:non-homologous end joining protein Ku